VTVQASDGSLTSSQAIAVTVGDVTNETLFGTPNSDALTTEDGNDTIRGLASDDTLVSGAGNDVLDGGLGADHMTGGTGDDTYVLDNAGDVVVENAGEGKDTIRAAIDIAAFTAEIENLTLVGTANTDGHGNAKDNVIKGNSGNNMLFGLAGNDLLVGGAGNDVLNGGTGADRMKGGTGNDVYIVASFNDRVIENAGEGTDTIRSYISISALADNVENLSLYGRADLDGGRAGIDGVGNGLDNQIRGNNGDNQLYGLGGMDRLFGGLCNDILSGGAGRDVLVGGAGQDTFLFDTALDSHANVDCLKDFAGSGVDNIQLGRSVFTAFTHTGSLTADEFYAAAGAHSAHDASDRIIYETTTGNLFYDADGIGGADEVQFATLGVKTHPQLLFSDIAIYA
jgi:Ca2+-binding RTX toxin-like protein